MRPSQALTVLANLAVDRIDGAPPSAGGCASFAVAALEHFGAGRIVAQAAEGDLPLFEAALTSAARIGVDVIAAQVTSAFGLHYEGDDRTMTVDAVGPVWDPGAIRAASIETAWVHVSPLLRSDFPPETIGALATAGHRVVLDGQGLVRVPKAGPLELDDAFDRGQLADLTVLKFAEEEARVAAGGRPFDEHVAARLGVPEILVTSGSRGCDLYVGGRREHVPPAWPVTGVQPTGAGDMFTVAYAAARARGDAPSEAAGVASRLVAELLQVRLEALGG